MSNPTPTNSESPASTQNVEGSLTFESMVHQLQNTLRQLGPIAPTTEPVQDPIFGGYIDAHLIAQQGVIVQRCETLAKGDFENYRATSIMQRSLALIEKTRTRILKSKQFDIRAEIDRLKALEGSSQPDRHEARLFLQTELAAGDRPAKELFALGESLGLSRRTLQRAKSELGIASVQKGNPDNTHSWLWSLPKSASTTSTESQTSAPAPTTAQQQIALPSLSIVNCPLSVSPPPLISR